MTSIKKLFDALVSPIVEYGAAIWGCKNFSFINAIQMRACRFFLGVGKYTPNPAIMGDMGWIPIYHTQWKVIARHWHRLVNMEPDRINRKIFIWADEVSLKHRIVKNWNFIVKKHFTELELVDFCNTNTNINKNMFIDTVMSRMFDIYIEEWKSIVNSSSSRGEMGGIN